MKSIFRRVGLPHLVAVLAVALVVGSGTAYAAQQITSKNIKNETIKSKDVKDGALTGADLADGSVTSADVATDTLTAADLAPNSVGTSEILDSTITSTDVAADTLTAADLAPNSVGSSEIADNAVTQTEIATDGVAATEIQDNSIDAGEIIDFGLTNEDIGVLAARVAADGSLTGTSGTVGVTSSKIGTGQYDVNFGRNVTACTYEASVGTTSGAGIVHGFATVHPRLGTANAVFVQTHNNAGANTDEPFHLIVVC